MHSFLIFDLLEALNLPPPPYSEFIPKSEIAKEIELTKLFFSAFLDKSICPTLLGRPAI